MKGREGVDGIVNKGIFASYFKFVLGMFLKRTRLWLTDRGVIWLRGGYHLSHLVIPFLSNTLN